MKLHFPECKEESAKQGAKKLGIEEFRNEGIKRNEDGY
jgi:hypothetical protein